MENEFHYDMEEIMPIVQGLVNRYTSGESSSVTYEAAQQLMGAVVYCIRYGESFKEDLSGETAGELWDVGGLKSAKQAYDWGVTCIHRRLDQAMELYDQLMEHFDDYENRAYRDTVKKGMPVFFQRYDAMFRPEDYLLTLDYPVNKDLKEYQGVERIYRYLQCIAVEQEFLRRIPRSAVIERMTAYSRNYRDNYDNIMEIVCR